MNTTKWNNKAFKPKKGYRRMLFYYSEKHAKNSGTFEGKEI